MLQKWKNNDGTECTHGNNPATPHSFVEHCTCNFYATLINPVFVNANEFFVSRYDEHGPKTSTKMIEEFAVKLAATWKLHRGVFERVQGDIRIQRAILEIIAHVGENQIPIAPPIHNATIPKETNYKHNLDIIKFYKIWDRYYFDKYYNICKPESWWNMHIWKTIYDFSGGVVMSGTPWEDKGDLLVRSVRAASFYNQAFCGVVVDGVRYCYGSYAQEGLYPTKVPELMKKYNKPTHVVPQLLKDNMHVIPIAISAMSKFCGWDKKFRTLHWSFERNRRKLRVPLTTSSGNRPGPNPELMDEIVNDDGGGVRVYRTVTGKKVEHLEWVLNALDEAVDGYLKTGILTLPPQFWKIVIKSEVHLATGKDKEFLESLKNIAKKAREFFIPDEFTLVLAILVHLERQQIERAENLRGIMIGHSWWHGGMDFFAEAHRYTDSNRWWLMFDIKGFDTSVIELFLNLYSQFTQVYYSFTDPAEQKLFKLMLDEVTLRLGTKVTQMIGNIWRVIRGVMPSGAFETSHGDSWIVILVFFCYMAYTCMNDVDFRRNYATMMKDMLYSLGVYGDDNVSGFPDYIKKWFDVELIRKFFKDFANFTLRDMEMTNKFLSVPDGKGGIKEKGVVFLQKYAIPLPVEFHGPNMPNTVHYRDIRVSVQKFAKGSGDHKTNVDYKLAFITAVYDNPANMVWWEFCQLGDFYFSQRIKSWEDRVDEAIKNKNSTVSRMLRKCSISRDQLMKGFPTFNDVKDLLIKDRVKYDNLKYQDIWEESYNFEGNTMDY